MAVTTRGLKHPEDAEIDFRKRIWTFWCLINDGWSIPPDALADAKTLDGYLVSGNPGDPFLEARRHYMRGFDGSGHGVQYREPGARKSFYWVKEDEARRFFSWAIPYWSERLGYGTPLCENQYLPEREKLRFWLDVLPGMTGEKEAIESQIKSAWFQNKKIDRYIPGIEEEDEKKVVHFWEKTQLKLKDGSQYSIARRYQPGFDTPVGKEDFWHSSVLLYDLSENNFEVKKDIIQKINSQWRNNNRPKKQKNLWLSLDVQSKLKEIAALKGVKEGELVESLIWQEAQKLSSD